MGADKGGQGGLPGRDWHQALKMSRVWARGDESHRGPGDQGGKESDNLTATQPDLTLSLNSASCQRHGLGGAWFMREGEPGADMGRVGLGELGREQPP